MRRCFLIIVSFLLTGVVAAQSASSSSGATPDVENALTSDAWCAMEAFESPIASEMRAWQQAPMVERWPTIIPPVRAMRRNAPAHVYSSDPFSGDPIEVTLQGLLGDGHYLDGEFVRAGSDRLDGAGLAFNADGDFRYTPDTTSVIDCMTDVSRCAPFDAVNVYYHIDSYVRDYWIGHMGVTPSFIAEARVHTAGDGGFADWPTRSLKLGVGNIFMKNSALSDDIIYHEYNHLMMASQGFEIGVGTSDEPRALHEAYADYFMASWTDDARVGEWVITCPPRLHCTGPENSTDLRTLILDAEEWNWRQGQPVDSLKYGYCLRYHEGDRKCKPSWNNNANQYVWGMMWAAALWDLRTEVGPEIADRIALQAVREHTATTDFQTALDQLLSVGIDEYGSDVGEHIRRAFDQRGFLTTTGVQTELFPETRGNGPGIDVWPNPARAHLQVRSPLSTASQGSPWTIHDMMGRVVMRGETEATTRWSIPTGSLPPGVYHLRVGAFPSTHTVLFHKMH